MIVVGYTVWQHRRHDRSGVYSMSTLASCSWWGIQYVNTGVMIVVGYTVWQHQRHNHGWEYSGGHWRHDRGGIGRYSEGHGAMIVWGGGIK